MKRTFRELSDEQKNKISTALKHHSKSEATKQKISMGMKQYWSTIPSKYSDNNTTITDIML